jgi:hypothetical protein
MSDEHQGELPRSLSRWQEHRFLVMVAVAVLVALFLVSVALALYASSGTAQLDLSRPGYQSVREQAAQPDSFTGFPAEGSLTKEVFDEFQTLYDEKANQVTTVDSFSGEVMSDETLGIGAPASGAQ